MGNFLNMEGGLMTGLGKVFDICLISIIWVLCCVPIITAGAATTALYYTVVKVIRRDRGYLLKEYMKAFKDNFKNGTILWILAIVMAIIMYFNMNFARQMGSNIGYILLSVYRTLFFILLSVLVFLFPNLSRFTIGRRQLVKTSFAMSIKHLPTTIMVDILVVTSIVLTVYMPILIFVIPAVCCLLCSFLIERVLKKYMPKPDENSENSEYEDRWYLL